jgi:WD40 repeat protein
MKWWEVSNGNFIRKMPGGFETLLAPDGKTIAIVQHCIGSGGTDFCIERLGAPFEMIRHYTGLRGVFDSFDVRFYDSETGAQKRKLTGVANAFAYPWGLQFVPSVFSPDGKLLAAAASGELKIWNTVTGEKLPTIRKLDGSPLALAFSPDSKTIAIATGKVSKIDKMTINESEVSLWEVATAKLIRKLHGNNDFVSTLQFAGNGNALLFGTLQYEVGRTIGTVKVWDLVKSSLSAFNVHEGQKVSSIFLIPEQASIVLVSGENVELRDTRTWRTKCTFEATREDGEGRSASRFLLSVKQVTAVGYSPDSTTVSGVVTDDGIRFWDSRTGAIMKEIKEVKDPHALLARSADGRVLGELRGGELRLWDLRTGVSSLQNLANSTTVSAVSALALSHDAQLVAFAEDSVIKLRNVSDKGPALTLSGHQATVERIVFADDGRVLASSDESGRIIVWDARTGELKRTVESGHAVTALAIASSGQLLASAGADFLVSVWDARSGALQAKLRKHERTINALVFSSNGQLLASGGDDRMVILWDVVAGKSKEVLKGHDLTVTALAFSPDGQFIATGSGNASVVQWNVRNGKLDRILR